MKKFLLSLLGLLVVAAIAFFIFTPPMVERSMNMIDGEPLPKITAEAQKLHDSLMIVDLHSDTLLWKRKITSTSDYGHVDLKRMQAGNVGLQIFSSVSKTPKNQNYDSNNADTDNITLSPFRSCSPSEHGSRSSNGNYGTRPNWIVRLPHRMVR